MMLGHCDYALEGIGNLVSSCLLLPACHEMSNVVLSCHDFLPHHRFKNKRATNIPGQKHFSYYFVIVIEISLTQSSSIVKDKNTFTSPGRLDMAKMLYNSQWYYKE